MSTNSNYYQLAGAMIASAVDAYKTNRYPPNVSTTHSSPRMEALTFLHGNMFALFSDCAHRSKDELLEEMGIEPVSELCVCESCRMDYRAEAGVARDSPRFRFCHGERHLVYWRKDNISRVRPVRGVGVPASEYIENYKS